MLLYIFIDSKIKAKWKGYWQSSIYAVALRALAANVWVEEGGGRTNDERINFSQQGRGMGAY